MQRRDFIYLSAFTAAALALPVISGCGRQQINTEAQPYFFSHIADVKTIASIGLAYRKAHGEEDDKDKLTELLLANGNLQKSSKDDQVPAMLINKVENDFKTGKMAVVNGWVLSVTEARQCALFSLLQS